MALQKSGNVDRQLVLRCLASKPLAEWGLPFQAATPISLASVSK
jgi:hypothetical protein